MVYWSVADDQAIARAERAKRGVKAAPPDELRSEIERLRQEIRELREAAPPSRKPRSSRPKPDVR